MERAAVGWKAAVLVGAMVCLAACAGGSDEAEPRTTVPTAPALTTTTNPYAVPEVIDVAYVNRVLAGLDAAVGDVVRMVVEAGHVTPGALERMRALYTGDVFAQRVNSFTADSADGFADYRPDPGNSKTTVNELITAHPACIFSRVFRDFSEVGRNPDPELTDQYIALERVDPAQARVDYNPTGWIVIYEGFLKSRTRPPDPCVSVR